MTNKKCCIKDCPSEEGKEEFHGTFHRFPQTNPENQEKWIKACKVNFKPGKHHFVCSLHFKRENFSFQQSGKIILKSLTVPSVFPWNKDTVVVTKSVTSIVSNSVDLESSEKKKKSSGSDKDPKEEIKINLEEEQVVEVPKVKESPSKSDKKKSSPKKKEEETLAQTPELKKKSSKRLSAKFAAAAASSAKKAKKDKEVEVVVVEKPKSKVPESPVSKKKNQVTSFIPGSTIEAQNFDGKWIPVKVIEVDMDEREVLVRSNEKNKSKAGTNDEWISMDSSRLRPAQPAVTYEVGEKVLARWNDCRKFPATIQRVLENDTYDVLFDDGYPKIVRGIHIHKYSPGKTSSKVQAAEAPLPTMINPLLLNPPSLIPEYVKQMIKDKKVPDAPTEGEWCCAWVDDIPVGEESSFDGTHGKCPSIIVPDWRVKEGWQKHIYLRQNGKWDVLFISPTGRKIRFKNELKSYLLEIGEIYDPETWDFSLQKKRSKAKNLCIQSEQLKQQQVLPQSFEVKAESTSDGPPVFNNPFATLGALPYVQPNLVQSALSTQSEVSVGSLKVKVINNVFYCPAERCDKQFRKENHLQLHIKHYHEDLAKLMGECPNMEDLAYLRTTGTIEEAEVSIVKTTPRPKPSVKSTPTSSTPRPSKELSESVNSDTTSPSTKFNAQRSPILEEALKAPLIGNQPVRDFVIKIEPLSQAAIAQFDPETLIPPHAVSRVQNPHHPARGHHKRRLKLRFNPKSKKPFKKKIITNVGSTVEGVIPYNEGPYLKNQPLQSYVDENGEVIKIVRMKKEEIINCICGYGEEDGLMIQCDICLCWQHGWCHGIENAHQVPEKYICTICKNPYRQRASMRWTHDQDWLYDGKLPIASYHAPYPKQAGRVETLKNCHTLIGNLMEMKKFMKSLDVKINIAENIEHPKLYLWSKKWEQSPPRDIEMKDESKIKGEGDLQLQPIAPEPEAAIEPAKCRQSLLDHIQNQQSCVKSRLDNIEAEIEALEDQATKNGDTTTPVDDATLKQTLYMLINDLKRMNNFSDIHRNPVPSEI